VPDSEHFIADLYEWTYGRHEALLVVMNRQTLPGDLLDHPVWRKLDDEPFRLTSYPHHDQPLTFLPLQNSATVLAGSSGVYRSADAGLTWNTLTQGLAYTEPRATSATCCAPVFSLQQVRAKGARLVYAAGEVGVAVSSDDGATWHYVTSVYADPRYTGVRLVALIPDPRGFRMVAALAWGLIGRLLPVEAAVELTPSASPGGFAARPSAIPYAAAAAGAAFAFMIGLLIWRLMSRGSHSP
jgi:hypothetical protein